MLFRGNDLEAEPFVKAHSTVSVIDGEAASRGGVQEAFQKGGTHPEAPPSGNDSHREFRRFLVHEPIAGVVARQLSHPSCAYQITGRGLGDQSNISSPTTEATDIAREVGVIDNGPGQGRIPRRYEERLVEHFLEERLVSPVRRTKVKVHRQAS